MDAVSEAIERGVEYLRRNRYQNGSFPAVKLGDHGGAWTTAEALLSLYESGVPVQEDWVNTSVEFLINKQRPDGSWYLISEPPSSTMSTADAVLALCRSVSADWIDQSLEDETSRAISMGFRWLEIGQNQDGGWGIEYRPYTEEGDSRINPTFHAVRALGLCGATWLPDDKLERILTLCAEGLLESQDQQSGSWGLFRGGQPSVYATARAVRALSLTGQVEEDSPSIAAALGYIRENQDDPSLSSIEEELITRAVALLRVDCHTPYELVSVLVESESPDLKLVQLVKWFLDTQNKDGSWNLRCPVTQRRWEATMWVTCDVVLALADFRSLVSSRPDFLLRSFLSRFPRLVTQDALRAGLRRRGVDTLDELLEVKPFDMVAVLPAALDLDVTVLDAIDSTLDYATWYSSEGYRRVAGESWFEVAQESDDMESKAFCYGRASEFLKQADMPEELLGLSATYEALLALTDGEVTKELEDRLAEAVDALEDMPGYDQIAALHQIVHEYLGFKHETDPFMVALRGTRAILAIEKLRKVATTRTDLSSVFEDISFSRLRQGIQHKLATLSSELESSVITEIQGDLKEGQPGTLRVRVRTIGLPVYNLLVGVEDTSVLHVSEDERAMSVVNINWSDLLFTVTAIVGGRVRVPIAIQYTDVNQCKHQVTREHEIRIRRSTKVEAEETFSEISNPYVAGPSVLHEEMFFGRRVQVSAVVNSVKNTNQPYAVVGPRRIGKTSFLRALERRFQDNPDMIALFFDIEGVTTPLEFLGRLCEDIVLDIADSSLTDRMDRSRLLEDIAESTILVDQLGFLKSGYGDDPETSGLRTACRKTEAVLTKIDSLLVEHEMKCVILLDEIGVLGRMPGSDIALGFLRSLVQKLTRFVFVVAGPDVLFELTSQHHPFFNLFEKIPLRGLSERDANALMIKPVPDVDYEHEALEQIYSITGGNPYYLQAVCRALIRVLNDKHRYRVTLADAESVIEQVVFQLDDQIRFQWRDTTREEHLVLAGIATLGGACDVDQITRVVQETADMYDASDAHHIDLAGALQRLVEKGYLTKEGTHYDFADGVFRRWVALRYNLSDILKEEFRNGGSC